MRQIPRASLPPVLVALLGVVSLATAEPQAGPPADKTTDQIWGEIWTLEVLNKLELTQAQLKQILPLVQECRKRHAELQKLKQNSAFRKALWAIRMAMLKGQEPGELWEKIEAAGEKIEQREGALERLRESSLKKIVAALTAEQQKAIGLFDSPESHLADWIEELADVVAEGDADEWTEWRDQTAEEIAEIAADVEEAEEPVKSVATRAAALFDETKPKGAGFIRDNADKLAQQLVDLAIPEVHRTSADEQQERLEDFLREWLEDGVLSGLLEEKLALVGK